jgi:hypothetical protein
MVLVMSEFGWRVWLARDLRMGSRPVTIRATGLLRGPPSRRCGMHMSAARCVCLSLRLLICVFPCVRAFGCGALTHDGGECVTRMLHACANQEYALCCHILVFAYAYKSATRAQNRHKSDPLSHSKTPYV